MEKSTDLTNNLQAIFDQVVSGLRRQGRKAADDSDICRCRYRIVKEGGMILKCAAGQLIPDEDYNPNFEGSALYYQPESMVSKYFFNRFSPNEFDLIKRLQGVHDENRVEFWEDKFRKVAEEFNLVWKDKES